MAFNRSSAALSRCAPSAMDFLWLLTSIAKDRTSSSVLLMVPSSIFSCCHRRSAPDGVRVLPLWGLPASTAQSTHAASQWFPIARPARESRSLINLLRASHDEAHSHLNIHSASVGPLISPCRGEFQQLRLLPRLLTSLSCSCLCVWGRKVVCDPSFWRHLSVFAIPKVRWAFSSRVLIHRTMTTGSVLLPALISTATLCFPVTFSGYQFPCSTCLVTSRNAAILAAELTTHFEHKNHHYPLFLPRFSSIRPQDLEPFPKVSCFLLIQASFLHFVPISPLLRLQLHWEKTVSLLTLPPSLPLSTFPAESEPTPCGAMLEPPDDTERGPSEQTTCGRPHTFKFSHHFFFCSSSFSRAFLDIVPCSSTILPSNTFMFVIRPFFVLSARSKRPVSFRSSLWPAYRRCPSDSLPFFLSSCLPGSPSISLSFWSSFVFLVTRSVDSCNTFRNWLPPMLRQSLCRPSVVQVWYFWNPTPWSEAVRQTWSSFALIMTRGRRSPWCLVWEGFLRAPKGQPRSVTSHSSLEETPGVAPTPTTLHRARLGSPV